METNRINYTNAQQANGGNLNQLNDEPYQTIIQPQEG